MPSSLYNALQSQANQKTALPIPKAATSNPGYMSTPVKPTITATVPGSQKPAPTPFNSTINPKDTVGTLTAAGNSSLQGRDYYTNLTKSSNPAEKLAGETWLKKNTVTMPLDNVGGKNGSTGGTGKTGTGTTGTTTGGTGATTGTKTGTTVTVPGAVIPDTTPKAGTTGKERANAVIESAQDNPEIAYYRNMALKANEAQNVGRLAPYAESKFYGQGGQSQGALPDLTLPDLAGRGSSNQALFGTLGNIYGSTAQTGLSNALAERTARQQAATTVLGAGSPSGNIINVDPFTGQPVGGGNLAELARQAGTISGIQSGASSLASDYQTGNTILNAANGIRQQISNTLNANPALNVNPVTFLNEINQYLGANFSGTPQQQLAQQVQSYITTLERLGVEPATITNIAHQSGGSIVTLLDSLYNLAETVNESKNISGGTSSTSGGSTGGGFAEGQTAGGGSLIFKGGKWVKA